MLLIRLRLKFLYDVAFDAKAFINNENKVNKGAKYDKFDGI